MLYHTFFGAALLILVTPIVTPIIGSILGYWIFDLNTFIVVWLVIAVLGHTALGDVFYRLYAEY